mmetsp:Transcript_12589/g.29196  ORF Transcript_12589/g.29196 Transcript_12589/m.29196 type:complete len:92 (+) Transcript_12589:93-368(+)
MTIAHSGPIQVEVGCLHVTRPGAFGLQIRLNATHVATSGFHSDMASSFVLCFKGLGEFQRLLPSWEWAGSRMLPSDRNCCIIFVSEPVLRL